MNNPSRLICLLIATAAISMSHSALAKADMCQPSQLKISELALSTPGMSQTWGFYAIQNISKAECRIYKTAPDVSAVLKSGDILPLSRYVTPTKNTKTVTLKPSKHQEQLGGDLVWFSIHADAAHQPGDPGYNPEFSDIKVTLDGINHAFETGYKGYYSGVNVTAIEQGISDSLARVQCTSDPKSPHAYFNVKNTTMIHFDQLMDCS